MISKLPETDKVETHIEICLATFGEGRIRENLRTDAIGVLQTAGMEAHQFETET